MRVAVTGSTGLIGEALIEALAAAGHEPVRVIRSTDPGDRPTIAWDPDRGEIDEAGLSTTEAVVHLAGAGIGDKRWSDERKAVVRDSRLVSTSLLAGTLAEIDGPRTLVSASAIGYYGDRGDEVLTEGSDPGEGFLADLCVSWEAAADPARDAGVRVVHPRTALVLTDSGGALGPMLPLFKLGLGGKLGPGDQWWSWISLTDHVRALVWVLENDVSGPVNLSAPDPARNSDFVRTLGRVLNRPAILPVPTFALKLRLGGEMAEQLVLASARVEPAVLAEGGFDFEHPGLEQGLRAELG